MSANGSFAPPVPVHRGPPDRTPRDGGSDAPPRRPPSRSASREQTPRSNATPTVVPLVSPGHASRPFLPTPRPTSTRELNLGNGRRASDAHSAASLQFLVDDDDEEASPHTRTESHAAMDTESIQFEMDPTSPAPKGRARSSVALTDDITFQMEPSQPNVADGAAGNGNRYAIPLAPSDHDLLSEDIAFQVEPSRGQSPSLVLPTAATGAAPAPASERDLLSDDIAFQVESSVPPTDRGGSIEFHAEPSQRLASVTATSDIHFTMDSQGGQTPTHAEHTAPTPPHELGDTPVPPPNDVNSGVEKLSIDREEPPTEVVKPSLEADDDGDEVQIQLTSQGSSLPASLVAKPTLEAAVDVATPKEVAPDVPAAAAPTPSRPEPRATTTPATDARVSRGGGTVPPAARASTPRRQPTTPRQPRERSRAELMNDRPWRVASPVRAGSPKKPAAKEEEEPKPRAVTMSDRPWRDAARNRTPSPNWARRKSAEEQEREAAAARQVRHVKTRSELMNERPWRTGSRTPSPTNNKKKATAKKKTTAAPSPVPPPLDRDELQPKPRGAVPRPHPVDSAASTPLVIHPLPPPPLYQKPRDVTPTAAASWAMTTPPPVLLRSPWAVLAEETKDWTEMANPATHLRQLQATARERERAVAGTAQRIRALEQDMKHVDKELYAIRDRLVRMRGVDVNGDALRPEPRALTASTRSPSGGGGAMTASVGAASTKDDVPDFAARLYPQSARPSPVRYPLTAGNRQRQVSVLSDEDLSESETTPYEDELEAWRKERAALRATKSTLVHRSKDLKFHLRRGTNIKDLSALTVTSNRPPIERAASGRSGRVDEFGYDVLAKLRLEAAEAQYALDAAKERHTGVQGTSQVRRREHQRSAADVEAKRDKLRQQFEELTRSLEDNASRARSLTALVNQDAPKAISGRGSTTKVEEIEFEVESSTGGSGGWRSPALDPLLLTAEGADVITQSETKRDTTRVLQTRAQEAEDVLARARGRLREAKENSTKRRSRSRSASRPGTARIKAH